MAQIPMVNRSLIEHRDGYAPLNGAPGGNWNVDNSLADLGAALSDGVRQTGMAALNFAEMRQRADDADNYGQIRLIRDRLDGELDSRMKENPNAFGEFESWHMETEQQIAEETKPYLEKLSPAAARDVNVWLSGRKQQIRKSVHDTAFQADITTKRGNYDDRIKFYAKTGNLDAAREQLALAVDTGIYSQTDRETMARHIDSLADFGAAERLIAANPNEAASQLSARGDTGGYRNFTNLDEDDRRRLLNYAATSAETIRQRNDEAFLASIAGGEPQYSRTQLKQLHESGQITDKQFSIYSGWLETHENKISAAAKAKKSEEKSIAADREKSKKQADKDAENAFLYRLNRTDMPMDPGRNILEKKKLLDEIEQRFGDPEQALRLVKAVNERSKLALSGGDEFTTHEGAMVRKFIDDTYRNGEKFQGLKRDPWGWEKYDSQEFMQARYYEIEEMAREQIRTGHNAQQVIANIKTEVERLNDGAIINIISGNPITPQAYTKEANDNRNVRDGSTGTIDGKKVIYRNGAWQYAE